MSAERLAPGARLGRYEIVASIGAGGMGQVSRARDTRLNRTVAIKVLLDLGHAEPQLRERFEREAARGSRIPSRRLAELQSPVPR